MRHQTQPPVLFEHLRLELAQLLRLLKILSYNTWTSYSAARDVVDRHWKLRHLITRLTLSVPRYLPQPYIGQDRSAAKLDSLQSHWMYGSDSLTQNQSLEQEQQNNAFSYSSHSQTYNVILLKRGPLCSMNTIGESIELSGKTGYLEQNNEFDHCGQAFVRSYGVITNILTQTVGRTLNTRVCTLWFVNPISILWLFFLLGGVSPRLLR